MKNPITEKQIGIVHDDWLEGKFRDVRHKASVDFEERKRKAKRNKQIKFPKYKIGDKIILSENSYHSKKEYFLMEIIDFEEKNTEYIYYGILLKTTSNKYIDRIGRLIYTREGGFFSKKVEKISGDNIKWIELEQNNE